MTVEALAVAGGVTLAVAALTRWAPDRWHSAAVGGVFLGSAWALVWSRDDDCVRRAGLTLGGLVMPGKLDLCALSRSFARALGWACALAAVVAVPFFVLWRRWWVAPASSMSILLALRPIANESEVFGQIFVVALPEEAFYRGYLQSRLDDAWGMRVDVLGARVGPGLLASAAIFAIGHLATVPSPARLAVFFPALLFGWLRARTGGIGASVFFHAFCNLYSEALGSAYGVYAIG
ncbi:MAG: myxosortase MrtC [Polyangiaceae bacterium]